MTMTGNMTDRPDLERRRAQRRLRKQKVAELMNAHAALTHRMHALAKTKTEKPRGDPARKEIDEAVDDLRQQRNLIVREIERRCGER